MHRLSLIFFIVFCTGILFGCSDDSKSDKDSNETPTDSDTPSQQTPMPTDTVSIENEASDTSDKLHPGTDARISSDHDSESITDATSSSEVVPDAGSDQSGSDDSATASETENETTDIDSTEQDEDTAKDAGTDEDGGEPIIDRCAACLGFKGADILVVVDNSGSMAEEQELLATQFYTLLNALIDPTEDWEYPAAQSLRVGIVSSDLGLQWGDGQTGGNTTEVKLCSGDTADDGVFKTDMPQTILVATNQIKCDEDASQCPSTEWTCNNNTCVTAPNDPLVEVSCPTANGTGVPETTPDNSNNTLVTQVSCMAQLGTEGCGVEQQLQASVRALTRADQQGFLRDDHVLAVVIVSDEEDCSIKDNGLFQTPEWQSGASEHLNIACNYPQQNNEYLFAPEAFHDRLVALKGGREHAVLFSAIVGVPAGEDSPCQGTGDDLVTCLDQPEMEMNQAVFELEVSGQVQEYIHFQPACTRTEGDKEITSARPGRRYVTLAQRFGCAGYIYSICNADWSPAMQAIANSIARCIRVV